jgi:hypothetical protein
VEADQHNGTSAGSETEADAAQPHAGPGGETGERVISRRRLFGVRALIGVTTLLLIVAMFAIWANRLLFNPDQWSNTSTQLLENPDIRSATANYLVDQLYANADVAGVLKSGLPPALQSLAAPAAGALRNAAVQGTELALSRPRVQSLWAQANRAADQAFIAIVNGGKGSVAVNQGVVTLNLGAILNDVATRLGLPSNLSEQLPPNVANLTVAKSNQVKFLENVGNAIKGLALWLTILVPLLYVLALALSRGQRRRTLMTIGFAAIFAGVVVLFGRKLLESQLTSSLTNDATLRPAIRATIAIGTSLLSEVAGAVIFVAVVLIAAAWFAGPARPARLGRQAIAPFLRERPVAAYAIALGIMALVFIWNPIPATGKPAGIIVFTVMALVGTEVLIRQTAREFPDARPGAARHAIRARWGGRQSRGSDVARAPAPAAASATTAEQLRQLADLRDHGEITPDEYQTAKAKLLHD